MNVMVLASGGLDSATLAHELASEGHSLHLLSVNYGQRHICELRAAEALGELLGAPWHCVDLSASGLSRLLAPSALTNVGVEVPDGHYEHESMRVTVVPNRNALLLSLAFAAAVGQGCQAVAMAAHGGDHFIYADCRPEFLQAFAAMEAASLDGDPHVDLLTPFVDMSKADIVRRGAELGVRFEETWSCYRGGDKHCGTCGTCTERREAFAVAGVPDHTAYAQAMPAG